MKAEQDCSCLTLRPSSRLALCQLQSCCKLVESSFERRWNLLLDPLGLAPEVGSAAQGRGLMTRKTQQAKLVAWPELSEEDYLELCRQMRITIAGKPGLAAVRTVFNRAIAAAQGLAGPLGPFRGLDLSALPRSVSPWRRSRQSTPP